jgi:hypothetical protein
VPENGASFGDYYVFKGYRAWDSRSFCSATSGLEHVLGAIFTHPIHVLIDFTLTAAPTKASSSGIDAEIFFS